MSLTATRLAGVEWAMRAGVVAVMLALLAVSPVAAASRDCPSVIERGFRACLVNVASATRKCLVRDRTCSTGKARQRLETKVVRACSEDALRDAQVPLPTDPVAVASRLSRACVANASSLVEPTLLTVGPFDGPKRACGTKLLAASTRLAARTLELFADCRKTGGSCDRERVETKIAAAQRRASAAVAKRCDAAGISETAVNGVLARARSQMTCALAVARPRSPACAPSGGGALVDLWSLPMPRPPGASTAQVSSYDRTGGNADLGIGPDTAPLLATVGLPPIELDFSYLYKDGDRYVIFDEQGPGVVWRIWMTGLDGLLLGGLGGDVQFELDDEAEPRLVTGRQALFADGTPPFVPPLAGDLTLSSGGFYSIVPIAFSRRLRISTSTVPNWVQVTFSRLPPDQAVASFDPTENTATVANLLAQAGDPSTTVTPATTDDVAVSVDAGAQQMLWERAGAGTIVRLELLGPAATDLPIGLRLQAVFDDAPMPQIDVPLDDLFGASLGAGARSLGFGRDGDRWYFYLPMPFASGARLVLRNDGADAFSGWQLRVGAVSALPSEPPAHLHAVARAAHLLPDGDDYVLLAAAGAGHVVGVVLTAGCGAAGQCQLPNISDLDGAHLEGDERITIDGSRWPQIHGTGLEDFFSGGFYFLTGAFTLPTHGNPVQVPGTSPRRPGLNLRSAYRLFLGDAIPFRDGIRLAIEHGPTNDVPAEFSSAVFYYAEGAARSTETDRLTLGDSSSQAAHGLEVEESTVIALTSAFRGDASSVNGSFTGMTARLMRFQLAIDPQNRGVRLRRLTDLAAGTQRALVSVDGAAVGWWQTADVNPFKRWADVDFEIPAALTEGKSSIDVVVDAALSPHPWTAFEYVALSHLP